MYLSRLFLNPRSREVLRGLANLQKLHVTIMSAFPQIPEENARAHLGVLHRLEVDHRRNRLVLYVQSLEEPDWSLLEPGYLENLPGIKNPECKRVGDIYKNLQDGAELAFRLQANPTRRVDSKNKQDGPRWHRKRVDLRREEDQIAWLRRKGEQGGFDILGVRIAGQAKNMARKADENEEINEETEVQARRHLTVAPRAELGMKLAEIEQEKARERLQEEGMQVKDKARRKKTSPITLASVIFEGRLRITDADKFYHQSIARGIGPGKAYGLGLMSLALHD